MKRAISGCGGDNMADRELASQIVEVNRNVRAVSRTHAEIRDRVDRTESLQQEHLRTMAVHVDYIHGTQGKCEQYEKTVVQKDAEIDRLKIKVKRLEVKQYAVPVAKPAAAPPPPPPAPAPVPPPRCAKSSQVGFACDKCGGLEREFKRQRLALDEPQAHTLVSSPRSDGSSRGRSPASSGSSSWQSQPAPADPLLRAIAQMATPGCAVSVWRAHIAGAELTQAHYDIAMADLPVSPLVYRTVLKNGLLWRRALKHEAGEAVGARRAGETERAAIQEAFDKYRRDQGDKVAEWEKNASTLTGEVQGLNTTVEELTKQLRAAVEDRDSLTTALEAADDAAKADGSRHDAEVGELRAALDAINKKLAEKEAAVAPIEPKEVQCDPPPIAAGGDGASVGEVVRRQSAAAAAASSSSSSARSAAVSVPAKKRAMISAIARAVEQKLSALPADTAAAASAATPVLSVVREQLVPHVLAAFAPATEADRRLEHSVGRLRAALEENVHAGRGLSEMAFIARLANEKMKDVARANKETQC